MADRRATARQSTPFVIVATLDRHVTRALAPREDDEHRLCEPQRGNPRLLRHRGLPRHPLQGLSTSWLICFLPRFARS